MMKKKLLTVSIIMSSIAFTLNCDCTASQSSTTVQLSADGISLLIEGFMPTEIVNLINSTTDPTAKSMLVDRLRGIQTEIKSVVLPLLNKQTPTLGDFNSALAAIIGNSAPISPMLAGILNKSYNYIIIGFKWVGKIMDSTILGIQLSTDLAEILNAINDSIAEALVKAGVLTPIPSTMTATLRIKK
jgi:hypothetical protein